MKAQHTGVKCIFFGKLGGGDTALWPVHISPRCVCRYAVKFGALAHPGQYLSDLWSRRTVLLPRGKAIWESWYCSHLLVNLRLWWAEIVSFARRFVCLESAEEVPEHRFIPKVGTEELWPINSRCRQWQMEKGIAGCTHKERDWTNGPKDTRSSQPKIIRWKNDIFRQPVNEQSKIVPTALTAD